MSQKYLDFMTLVRIFALMSKFLNDINGHYAVEKKAILSLCDKGMAYSLADLARELGTSIPKISRIVGEMMEEGYLADIVLYDMDKPYWYPRHDRMSLLVYAASANDADTVIVNGRVIMEKGEVKTLDAEKIYAEAGQIAARLTHH